MCDRLCEPKSTARLRRLSPEVGSPPIDRSPAPLVQWNLAFIRRESTEDNEAVPDGAVADPRHRMHQLTRVHGGLPFLPFQRHDPPGSKSNPLCSVHDNDIAVLSLS